MSPAAVRTLGTDESTRSSVLGLLSFHRNGYVRHEAIRLLAQNDDGSELPYLLIRQNDWVEPIRADARHAVQARLGERDLTKFVDSLPLVIHLLDFRRRDHSDLVRQLIAILVQPRHDELLAKAILSEDRETRRSVVRLAMDATAEHTPRVIAHALRSNDGVIRLCASRRVRECSPDALLERTLEGLERDRFMPVRREAFLIRSQISPDSGQEVWHQALLDGSASIRELARFSLRKLGEVDFSTFYRRAVVEQPTSLAAFCGLGETGDRSDLPLIRGSLKSRLPSRRRSAVCAFARLGGDSVIPELTECLHDDSPAVVRETRKHLERFPSLLDGDRLCQMVMVDGRPHVRTTALWLIDTMGKWRCLPWLIRAATHGDRATADLAQGLIERWFAPPRCNRVFTRPSPAERQKMADSLADSRQGMDETFVCRLEVWLKE